MTSAQGRAPTPTGRPAAFAHRSRARARISGLAVVVLVAVLGALNIPVASAATGELYLLQATDPHGSVWLPGTTDGTTSGPLDPGTDSTSAGFGHLWTTDVPSGFCRISPADPATGTAASLDQEHARRVHHGRWQGRWTRAGSTAQRRRHVLRLHPGLGRELGRRVPADVRPGQAGHDQVGELLAPNRYPANNKPFDVQMGPGDHKLYVVNDKDGNVARISGVNGPIAQQTVETSIAHTTDGARSRALTFACWSNLSTLGTGKVTRAAGAPGCTPSDPAPDLVLAQKNLITVVLNAETCQTAPGGCVAQLTNIKVLTPMGLRTDPKNPTVLYVSDSPGADSQIVRYSIGTDVQDSYANFGVLADGTTQRFSFAFDVAFDPQHAMYVGDDPSAGATAFNGHYYRIAPNAPADSLGRPGVPGNPPAPPSVQTGTLFGGSFGTETAPTGFAAPTLPSDGVWMGTHLWLPDSVLGLCRMDVPPTAAGEAARTLTFLDTSTCMLGANAGGLLKPEQSAYDATHHQLFVADGGTKSVGVVRFDFDPANETLGNPQVVASGLVGTGLGLDNQRADAVAIDPLTNALYVGFRSRNLGTNTQVARVPDAFAADTGTQTVDFIAKSTRTAPVFGLGVVVNPATPGNPATADLYVGDNKGVDVLTNVDACQPGACTSLLLLNVRGPRGFATDGVDNLYLAGPPAPGTGNSTTPVQRYTISTGELFDFSSVGVNPDATQSQYQFVFSLALAPGGDLYIADDPSAVVPPGASNAAHVWKVGAKAGALPAQPTITSKPGDPTNGKSPTFTFSTLTPGTTFQCSLVSTGSPDAYSACTSGQGFGPLTDGGYTFKVRAVDAAGASTPAVYSFTVDTVQPTVTIDSATASPSTNNKPSYTFHSSKPATTFECSLVKTGQAPAFSPCGSPQTYTAQPDGAYTFSVRGTDLAGNVSAVQSLDLTIDTTAPVVTAAPPGGPYPGTQSVTLTANEPASIFYTTDGTTPTKASTAYTGPITVSSTTTLQYIAVDPAGNTSAVGSQTYTIGSVSLDSKPADPSADPSPTFAFSAPGVAGATFQCALTSGAPTPADFSACTSPKTYPGTANGTYTFTVNGSDAAGASVGAATTKFTLDTAAPSLDSNPANPSGSSTETFAFTKAQATGWKFQCSFVAAGDPDGFLPCTSPKSYAGTADGSYTFKVAAFDAAGVSTAVKTYTFVVNANATAPSTTAPVQTLTAPSGPANTTAVPVTLGWSGSPNATAFELQQSINGGTFIDVPGCTAASPCTAQTASVKLKPSATNQSTVTTYRFQVRAQNSSGVFGAYTPGPTFSVPATDNTGGFSFNGGWSGVNLAGAYNGSVQESSTVGAFAQNSNPLVGTSVALVSTTGPDRGVAQLTLDGTVVGTVDLFSPTVQPAQIVWRADNLGAVGHTLRVTVLRQTNPSATGSKVDVDAYLALR